jgi:hypothetical protein
MAKHFLRACRQREDELQKKHSDRGDGLIITAESMRQLASDVKRRGRARLKAEQITARSPKGARK